MRRSLLIAALTLACLPACAATRPDKSHETPTHSTRRSVANGSSRGNHVMARTVGTSASLTAKNRQRSSKAVPSERASVRTASFRAPARTTGQTSTAASPVKSSKATRKRKSTRKRRTASRTPMQKAPTAERISEIQSALARSGYYQSDPNGKWDEDTVSALEKFQSANGLEPTGKLDALSLQKMGLGSEIAGVSAPRPIVHPSAAPGAPASPGSEHGNGTTPPSPIPDASGPPAAPGAGTLPTGATPTSDPAPR